MHGRPRLPKGLPEDPQASEASKLRLQKFSRVCNEVLRRIAAQQDDAESLKLSSALLEQNPECYTIWNYRRKALQGVLQGRDGSAAARAAAEAELALTERAIRKNLKSYAAWHHRRWVVEKGLTPLERELGLLGTLLDLDDRNFHGWAYRRFIVKLAGISAQDEVAYAKELINNNFSNYSAWHARTTLLHAVHAEGHVPSLTQLLETEPSGTGGAGGRGRLIPLHALQKELDLVQQAFFTDPEDQSAWFYHRWLLACVYAHFKGDKGDTSPRARQVLHDILSKEQDMCEQLLEVEPDRTKCKWPLLTLARLKELQQTVAGEDEQSRGEIQDLYKELIDIDPMRKGYYADVQSGNAQIITVPFVPG